MTLETTVAPIRRKPHGPRVGTLQRLAGPFGATGVVWYHGFLITCRLPSVLLAAVLEFFVVTGWLLLVRVRRAITANLEVVLGPCGFFARQRRVLRTLRDFAWCSAERYEQYRPGRPPRIDFEGDEIWNRVTASEAGFVLFTAHFGNWELGPFLDCLPSGRRIHIVREPEMNARTQRFIQRMHADRLSKSVVVHYAGADLKLGARLLLALRQGDAIAMPGDRPRAGMATISGELFGRPIDLPPGPAALARAADAMLVPVFVFRQGRRHYRVVLREPFRVERSDDKAADVRAAVGRIAREVEWAIRERPHHWFCWTELW